MPKWKPLKGIKVGHLTVLEDYRDDTKPKGNDHYCVCQCDCENKTIINVRASRLVGEEVTDCGCVYNSTKYIRNPLKDKKFGNLIVLEDYIDMSRPKGKRHMCKCQCSCENKNIVHMRADALQSATNPSCGCENPSAWEDLCGRKFGTLTVLKDFKENGVHMCECRCECGRIRIAEARKLNAKYIKSCGVNHLRPHLPNLSKTRFGHIFRGMRTRCNNPNDATYFCYGKRGIKCLWNSLDDFYIDMYESYCKHVEEYGEKDTTIERIDPNGNYCKENCRWATVMEQEQNKRNTHKIIDVEGELLSISGYCRKYNLPYTKIQYFGYSKGLNVKEALYKYLEEKGEILYEQTR